MYPKTCVELYNFFVDGKRKAAETLSLEVATAGWAFAKGGINGAKWVVER